MNSPIRFALLFSILILTIIASATDRTPENPSGTSTGLAYKFFTNMPANGGVLPSPFPGSLTPTNTGVASNYDINVVASPTDNVAYQFKGYIDIPSAGTWRLSTTSDDGSYGYIGHYPSAAAPLTTLFSNNNASQGATKKSGSVDLAVGKHAILVHWAQGTGGRSLEVRIGRQMTFKSASGSTATITTALPHGFAVGQLVNLNLASANTNYAANGITGYAITSVPTSTTFTYTKPNSTTFAQTSETGYCDVPIASAALSYRLEAAVPTTSPNPAVKIASTQVTFTLSCTTPSSTIYYTTDGTEPTIASTVYTGPTTANLPVTVKAIAGSPTLDTGATMTATYTSSNPPANDNFASAITLTGASPSTTGNNNSATAETGEPNHAFAGGSKSVWYKWVAPTTGIYYVSTAGSAIDTALGIYTGSAVNALTQVVSNDDAVDYTTTNVTTSLCVLQATANTTYYLAVDGFAGVEGNISLSISAGPVISITATTPNASETGPTNGVFTLTRTGNITQAITAYVDFGGTADRGADYNRIDDFVTFPANSSAAQTITIVPKDDYIYEGPETVIVTIVPGPQPLYSISPTASSATVTIADNESATTGTVSDTVFSVKRGFYSTPQTVSITTATPGATIRYTLDGSAPSPTAGTIYTTALTISSTTTLRAIAYKSGLNPTNVDTQTYIFTADVVNQSTSGPGGLWPPAGNYGSANQLFNYGMDPTIVSANSTTIQPALKALKSISIVMNQSDFSDPNTGFFTHPANDGYAWERACSFEIIDPNDSTNNTGAKCGIRLRGGFSRDTANPKHGFRFFFRKDYGKDTFDYPLFGTGGQNNLETFDLRTFQNYSWSYQGDRGNGLFIRDVFSRDSQLAISGFGTRGEYYHCYINGVYWGIYNTEERPEASFSANYFGGNKQDWDVIKSSSDGVNGTSYTVAPTDGSFEAWARLWKACKAGLSTNAAYFRIQGKNPDGSNNPLYENLVEIDPLIDYMLLIYYTGNKDSPISAFLSNASPNNWFGSRNRYGNSGFRFYTHDAEHTLLVSDLNINRISGPWPAGDTIDKSNPQWMFQQCMANAEFRIRVADHVRKHMIATDGLLNVAANQGRLLLRKNQLDQPVICESARWGDSKTSPAITRADWLNVYNAVVGSSYMTQRTTIVVNQLISAGLYPNVAPPTFTPPNGVSPNGGTVTAGQSVTISNASGTGQIYFTTDGSDPRAIGGSIGTTATSNSTTSSSVTISTTTTLRSRILVGGTTWSAMTEGTFSTTQDFTKLKVTEIMYNPPDMGAVSGSNLEFIELKNTGTVGLNLSGAYFVSGITYTFPSGTTIAPSQIIVLASNPQQYAVKYPAAPVPFGTYTGRLSNSGDTLTLLYSTGATVFSFSFGDAAPWPAAADGLGFSIVPVSPTTITNFGDAKQWRASTNSGGSPGADDPAYSIPTILVNEALTHADLPNHEYIELYNPGTSAADISGWYITDDRAVPQKYRIPNGTTITAGGFFTVDDTVYNATPGVPPSFGFDSHGEVVYLFSSNPATNVITGYTHGFKFGAAQNPVAFGRYVISTGEEHFVAQIANTQGSANSGPRVGPIVINEIMYYPASGGDQFIELLNISGSAVLMYDAAFPANTWKLNGLDFTFPQNITMQPNEYLLITAIDPATFRSKYSIPANIQVVGPWLGVLKTTGENLELQRPDTPDTIVPYINVDAVKFTNLAPWPLEPAGNGPSLRRSAATVYGNDPINWQKSTNNGGTPGTSESGVLAQPTNLVVSPISTSTLGLTWTDNSTAELNYYVQRSLDGVNNWTTVATLGANVTSVQDGNLNTGTTYYYRVYAGNASGSSPFSAVVSGTTLAPTGPDAPVSLAAVPTSSSVINLTWNDASTNETGFKIERSPDGVNGWTQIGTSPADTATYSSTGLSANTTYYFRVRAYNAVGDSAYSNIASGTTNASSNYTWNGGAGTWSVGTTGWNAGAWNDNNFAIIGIGTDTAGTIAVSGSVKPTGITFNAAQSGTYTVSGGTIDFNGVTATITASSSGAISSAIDNGSVVKTGFAALTLSGANTFSGAMSVNLGQLVFNGSLSAGAGVVTIAGGGASLRGTGTINRNAQLTGSNSYIWPGTKLTANQLTATEILTIAGTVDLSVASNNLLKTVVQRSSGRVQRLSCTSLTLGGTSVLDLGFDNSTASGTFQVIQATSPILTVFNNVTSPKGVYKTDYHVLYIDGSGATVATDPAAGTTFTAGQNVTNISIQFPATGVTPVSLESFSAKTSGTGVIVEWSAVSEYRNLGFNLYRRAVGGAEWTAVNEALIAGRLNAPDLKTYRVSDWPDAGVCEYRLESVSMDGEREDASALAGPVAVDPVAEPPGEIASGDFDAMTRAFNLGARATRAKQLREIAPAARVASVREISRDAAGPLSGTSAMVRAARNAGAAPSRTVAQPRWFGAAPPGASNGVAVKAVTVGRGAVWISASSLPAGFNPRALRVQREGRAVSVLSANDQGVLLFAPGYEDEYTDKDAFFLYRAASSAPASAPASISGLFGLIATPMASVSITQQFHDYYYDYALHPYNFPPWFSAQYVTENSAAAFALNAPGAAAQPARVTVNLFAQSDEEGASPDHALRAFVNGTLVGETSWDGGGKMLAFSVDIPGGVLKDGANTLELVAPVLPNVVSQLSLVHSISLDYTRTLSAAGPLEFTSASSAAQLFEVCALPSRDAWIVDARFPDRAALIPYDARAETDGTFTARFIAPAGGNGSFLVVPKGAELAPVSISKRSIKRLPANLGYLATGPAQFGSALQPLILARGKEGLRAVFADQEQLFDYYAFGRYGPAGIRNAIRSARPSYVLLAGRTTCDYRGYEGVQVDPMCPTILISASGGMQALGDALYGDLGRGFPEIPVGRFPANTPEEMRQTVRRVLGHAGISASSWRAQLAADMADPNAGDFAAISDSIGAQHPEIAWTRNYLGVNAIDAEAVREGLKAAANGGADTIIYNGHGNSVRVGLTVPRLINNDTIQEWTGSAVLIQNACNVNWFAKNESGWRSIAMQALSQPQGGIAASIGVTTFVQPEPSAAFTTQLLSEAAAPGARWGDALMRTQQWAGRQSENAGAFRDLMRTQCILGDPAMPVRAKQPRGSEPASSQPGNF